MVVIADRCTVSTFSSAAAELSEVSILLTIVALGEPAVAVVELALLQLCLE